MYSYIIIYTTSLQSTFEYSFIAYPHQLLVKDLEHQSSNSLEIWPEWMDTEGLDAEGAEHDNEKLVFETETFSAIFWGGLNN